MRIHLELLLIACLAASACGDDSPMVSPSSPELTSKQILTPIPEPFRNIWAEDASDCERLDGPTRVSIDPATVSFQEGRFDVVSLNKSGKAQLLLGVRFGGGPEQTHILQLSNTAETLSYTGPGIMRTLHRCQT